MKKRSIEYQNFSEALSRVLKVSHTEMQTRLKAEKKPSSKRASSGRASSDKG